MKKVLFCMMLVWSFAANAQVYNNEWIDYSKTYYKFKVGKTGLYRISQSVLSGLGLGSADATHFQLWRNGRQIPLYTSIAAGNFGSSDYIEFWGEMNDGRPDVELFRNPEWHLNKKWSLETDTAAYFLTSNPAGANLRLQPTANNTSTNTLPVDPFFVYTTGQYYRERLNSGYAVNVGEYLYSSSYDRGEGWSSAELLTGYPASGPPVYGKTQIVFNYLRASAGGPAPKFKIATSGNAINIRRFLAKVNSDSILSNNVDFFSYSVDSTLFSRNSLNSISDTVSVSNISACSVSGCPSNDRMVVHYFELTYAREFNFNGATNFEFNLEASPVGRYIEITNFSYSGGAPVLYDLTEGKRYVADISSPSLLKFAVQATTSTHQFVLVSEAASNVTQITNAQTRNFINYGATANQGDYMIISNPLLFAGSNGTNPVNDYRLYRSSAMGGSYTSRIYLADEVIDQFGFGIKKNPAGIRNFIRFARNTYTVKPKQVFIIGHGITYADHRSSEDAPDIERLDMIPTYGSPASDVLLACEPGSSQPATPIGRLSAINAGEVALYLKKVKDFEQTQAMSSASSADRAWTKNVVHILGVSEPGLETILSNNLDNYARIIEDTLFGGHVEKFGKSSTASVEQLNSFRLSKLFSDGINFMTYFGHSSSTTLEFNLDNPENYNNFGKYPLFIGLGCNAGNFFRYASTRLITKTTLSERYIFSPDRGTIGFIASTHFGIVHYLDVWATRAYQQIASKSYGRSLGEIIQKTAEDVFATTTQEDFYARCNTEQSELHGDPAIRLTPHAKPDYAVEDAGVKVSPSFVSIGESSFTLEMNFKNLGRVPNKDVVIEVKRQLPNQPATVYFRDTIPSVRFSDTVRIPVSINQLTDKGLNKMTVSIDPDNQIDELYETNNVVVKDVMIYEDEARPVYPYKYAIINQQLPKFTASTANPFGVSKQYTMEIDTTEAFNSPLKMTTTTTSAGGVMEFQPGMIFTDSTVYYWRVAPVPTSGQPTWNTSSFAYLPAADQGFGQSHFFQHLKSTGDGLRFDSATRKWNFGERFFNLFVRQGSWVTSASQEAAVSVAINGAAMMANTCSFQSLVFNVLDPVTFVPWSNTTLDNDGPVGHALYGSAANNCYYGRQYNFEYRWDSVSNRTRAFNFMKNVIPDGAYVVVRSFLLDPVSFSAYAYLIKYANTWKTEDEAALGAGQGLYYALKNAGFSTLDSFNRPRQFAFIYKKNDPSFTPKWVFTDDVFDNVTLSADCGVPDTLGKWLSPVFGPMKSWKKMQWNGKTVDSGTPGDNPRINIIGTTVTGATDTLFRNITQTDFDISSVNAKQYPYLTMQMMNADTLHVTPYHLRYWRLTGVPAPEGAIAPNISFTMKDTVDIAEPIQFKVAFKNISDQAFSDSVKVRMVVTDRNNVTRVLPDVKLKPLPAGQILEVTRAADTKAFAGANGMYIEVNPDQDQPEQYHFNNFFFKNFYVRGDSLNPLLDVTFDNVHILNYDLVSSKPTININLKDEAKYFLLDDPSKITVKVHKLATNTNPGYTRDFAFGNDTLQFIAAQGSPNADNTASAIFKPYFQEDGKYELIISGKDMSMNEAGKVEYRVFFEVMNKPMISNMLNYPNPFTTSTAFVFTLTGSQVPQNMRVQILTVTGKVVREITKDELGPIHIGRNITEFKWDGTDQYGQKLANGVYLYRVITNLNGKSLEKYTAKEDETDQYFNKGYGKMYLMR